MTIPFDRLRTHFSKALLEEQLVIVENEDVNRIVISSLPVTASFYQHVIVDESKLVVVGQSSKVVVPFYAIRNIIAPNADVLPSVMLWDARYWMVDQVEVFTNDAVGVQFSMSVSNAGLRQAYTWLRFMMLIEKYRSL